MDNKAITREEISIMSDKTLLSEIKNQSFALCSLDEKYTDICLDNIYRLIHYRRQKQEKGNES